jgi:hypothetical protein
LKSDNFLHEYASILWLFSNVVPDRDFMHDIDSACVAGINRKQELYGLKEDISKSDDDRILQEERELREGLDVFSESLRTFAMPGVDQKWSLRFRFICCTS